jgi:hypothetical protein
LDLRAGAVRRDLYLINLDFTSGTFIVIKYTHQFSP